MATIVVWILVGLPVGAGTASALPVTAIERFATSDECERVRSEIHRAAVMDSGLPPKMACVKATVVK